MDYASQLFDDTPFTPPQGQQPAQVQPQAQTPAQQPQATPQVTPQALQAQQPQATPQPAPQVDWASGLLDEQQPEQPQQPDVPQAEKPGFIEQMSQAGQVMMEGFNNEQRAAAQGVTPVVRDKNGKLNFKPIGELVPMDGGNFIQTPSGEMLIVNPQHNVILKDPQTGKMMVFEKTPDVTENRALSAFRLLAPGLATNAPTRIASGSMAALRQGGKVAAKRIADAADVKIPLTRGQASGKVKQQAFEEAARNNAKGPVAKRVIDAADDRLKDAIPKAVTALQEKLAKGARIAGTAQETADVVVEGVRNAARRVRDQGSALFKQALKIQDPEMATEALKSLPKVVQEGLETSGIIIDKALTPAARVAIREINALVHLKEAPKGMGEVIGIRLSGLERTRRRIGNLSATNRTDSAALRAVRASYDKWLEDVADTTLFNASPEVIKTLKKARAFWRAYRGITNPKAGDDAGRILAKMADPSQEVQSTEVVNWLFGASKVGLKGSSVRIAKRVKSLLGTGSKEWSEIRQGALLRAVNSVDGKPAKSAQALAHSLLDFVNGDGAGLAKTLYSRQEIFQIRKLAGALKSTVTPAGVTNASKSGFRVMESINGAISTLGAAIGFAHGGLGTAIMAKIALSGIPGSINAVKGIRAARPAKIRSVRTARPIAPVNQLLQLEKYGRPQNALARKASR